MIIIIMGVCGSGKSTVAQILSQKLGIDFIEGDTFHSEENVKKMANDEPLTEDDRIPWLKSIRSAIDEYQEKGDGAIVTCSALSRNSRRILGVENAGVQLVYLHARESILAQRMTLRENHFMPASLLSSQLESLEEPDKNEALPVNVEQAIKQVIEEIIVNLELF
jgi:gluconokinase